MTLLPDWAPNVHPIVVHFPIALWVAAVAADLLALVFRKASWADSAASFLYPVGAVGAALAFFTGRRAAASVLVPGMAFPLVEQHWNWALATTIGFALVAAARILLRLRGRAAGGLRAAVFVAALAALVSLVQTGDRGARLVFQRGVGVATASGSR